MQRVSTILSPKQLSEPLPSPLFPPLPSLRDQVQAARSAYEAMSFHEAVEAVVLLCSRGNQYLDEVKPWSAFKNVCCENGDRFCWAPLHSHLMFL